MFFLYVFFFFFKQKTAYEISECDWSSDVCSSDLACPKVVAYTTVEPAKVFEPHLLLMNFRSEERREGKSVKISVDLGGRRIIKKKKKKKKINKKTLTRLRNAVLIQLFI